MVLLQRQTEGRGRPAHRNEPSSVCCFSPALPTLLWTGSHCGTENIWKQIFTNTSCSNSSVCSPVPPATWSPGTRPARCNLETLSCTSWCAAWRDFFPWNLPSTGWTSKQVGSPHLKWLYTRFKFGLVRDDTLQTKLGLGELVNLLEEGVKPQLLLSSLDAVGKRASR